jgi:polyhydroxybutyrate depolymerase
MTKLKSGSFIKLGLSAFMKLLAGINLVSFSSPAGIDHRSFIVHDGLERTFHLHIPASQKKSNPVPLVIALHGRGGNGESMILVTRKGFDKLADKEEFFVVYPDGIELNWNDGRSDEQVNDRAHKENIDDVGFISALIDFMIKNYNIDPKRVYVTGISNGAILSYRLACEISHKIAAIAPVDGNIPQALEFECLPKMPVSLLAINNINDPLVPFDGGEIVGHFGMKKLGKVLSVNVSVYYWVIQNGCNHTPVINMEPDRDPRDGTRVRREEYSGGKDGSEVILYAIYGGGHTWPGGYQYLPAWIIGKTSRDIDANEIIWSFFKKHSR